MSKIRTSSNHESASKIELYISKYLPNSNDITLIDIGAHRGDFIDQIKKYYRIRQASLVEPTPDLATFLVSKYKDEQIRIFQNALSDKNLDTVDFQINVYGETSSLLPFKQDLVELGNVDTRLDKKVQLVTRTLDSIVNEEKYNSLDLIKIDVQGVEHLVLAGGKNALRITKFVWVELSFKPLYIGSSVFHDIYSLMEQNGFVLLEISPGHRSPKNELLQADALFANQLFL
ncbi:MAG TPA: FkbM family methyltransferase [Puia sp.]|nr:FkbM family methyltransferase [Puia sp.]